MVDPISLLAMIFGLVAGIRAAQEMWVSWRKSRAKKALGSDESAFKTFYALWERYNRIASVLGGTLPSRLDSSFQTRLLSLQPTLKQLNEYLRKFSLDDPAKAATQMKQIKRDAASLRNGTQKILDDIWKTVIQPGEKAMLAKENNPLKPIDCPRSFCQGALVLQNLPDEENLRRISRDELSESGVDSKTWGFTCKFCSLQIGRYKAIRMSKTGSPLSSQILLAASHLTSQRGILDRRAFYRCLACFQHGKEVEFATAPAFESHMERHPGFIIVRNEDMDEPTEKKATELMGPLPVIDISHDLPPDTTEIVKVESKTDGGIAEETISGEKGRKNGKDQKTSSTNEVVEIRPKSFDYSFFDDSDESDDTSDDDEVEQELEIKNYKLKGESQAFLDEKFSRTIAEQAVAWQELEANPSTGAGPKQKPGDENITKAELEGDFGASPIEKHNSITIPGIAKYQQKSRETSRSPAAGQTPASANHEIPKANNGGTSTKKPLGNSATAQDSAANPRLSPAPGRPAPTTLAPGSAAPTSPAPAKRKWVRLLTNDGQKYFYYCAEIGKSEWTLPPGEELS